MRVQHYTDICPRCDTETEVTEIYWPPEPFTSEAWGATATHGMVGFTEITFECCGHTVEERDD